MTATTPETSVTLVVKGTITAHIEVSLAHGLALPSGFAALLPGHPTPMPSRMTEVVAALDRSFTRGLAHGSASPSGPSGRSSHAAVPTMP